MTILIACGKSKARQLRPAMFLYTGGYFRAKMRWALSITNPANIYILSAKHGIIHSSEIIEPYDVQMTQSIARKLKATIERQAKELPRPIYTLCGAVYMTALRLADVEVQDVFAPVRSDGIGVQQAFLLRIKGQLP